MLAASIRVVIVQLGQFTLLNGVLNRGLFCRVECAIVVRVLRCEEGIHLRDVVEQLFGIWLHTVRRCVIRDFQCAIGNGLCDGFLLFRVELTVLISVERRELWERFSEVFHRRSGITVVMLHQGAVALSERESANGEAKHGHHCECFDVFHTIVCLLFLFPRHGNCLLPGQVANRLGWSLKTRCLPETSALKVEMSDTGCEMTGCAPFEIASFHRRPLGLKNCSFSHFADRIGASKSLALAHSSDGPHQMSALGIATEMSWSGGM